MLADLYTGRLTYFTFTNTNHILESHVPVIYGKRETVLGHYAGGKRVYVEGLYVCGFRVTKNSLNKG